MISVDLYTQATLKFTELNTQAQQREAVVQGRSLSHYRLRYNRLWIFLFFPDWIFSWFIICLVPVWGKAA
ncbi:MAG: hypothetical protein LBJ00_09285 [Planctomycetaceae bacterium]|nr:hypothetical protein [Planctomycetaceae bacterium]